MRPIIALIAVFAFIAPIASPAFAHCEIPCGIYDDEARLDMIAEHILTIEKSMNSIINLSKQEPLNYNQVVRWVDNKEKHADEVQHIVAQYFMTQRVAPVDKENAEAYSAYLKKLTLLHEMLVFAMKTKQTVDLGNVEKLRSLLVEFKAEYLGEQKH